MNIISVLAFSFSTIFYTPFIQISILTDSARRLPPLRLAVRKKPLFPRMRVRPERKERNRYLIRGTTMIVYSTGRAWLPGTYYSWNKVKSINSELQAA